MERREAERKKIDEQTNDQISIIFLSFLVRKTIYIKLILLIPGYEVQVKFQLDHDYLLIYVEKNFVEWFLLYQKQFVQRLVPVDYTDEFHRN
jgi:hypothetical protein